MAWSFDDYTLETGYTNEGNVPYASLNEFFALGATGSTHEEAVLNLRSDYEERIEFLRESGEEITVPGGPKEKAKFASTERMSNLAEPAAHFLENVLGTSYATSFVSDESMLCDWEHYIGDRYGVIERTKIVYGIDISDLYDKPIVDVLEHIKQSNKPLWKRFFERWHGKTNRKQVCGLII